VTSTLRDEIALREASIADARRELAAGEMTPEQCDAVVARESAAIARCRAALVDLPDAAVVATAPSSPRRHRRPLLLVALGCFLAVIVVVLVAALGLRQPGQSDTGNVDLTTQQRVTAFLVDGETDEANKNDANALVAYNEALVLAPTNIEALTQSGWLTFSAGSAEGDLPAIELGEDRIETAVRLDPSYPNSRLYYAIAAASTPRDRALAVREFKLFLALKPNVALLALATPWLEYLKIPVPTS
jgi:hypothetical protein